MEVVIKERIIPPNGQYDVHIAQMPQPLLTIQVRQKMAGIMEIDIFVMVAIKEIPERLDINSQVVSAGKCRKLPEQVRMPESDVGGVESAKAGTVGDSARVRIDRRHQGQHFVEDIILKLHMAANAVCRMTPKAI